MGFYHLNVNDWEHWLEYIIPPQKTANLALALFQLLFFFLKETTFPFAPLLAYHELMATFNLNFLSVSEKSFLFFLFVIQRGPICENSPLDKASGKPPSPS